MTFKLNIIQLLEQLPSISAFMEKLGHFPKESIVNIGTQLLWDIFKNKDFCSRDQAQILNAYGPKLIVLGLVSSNDYREQNLSPSDFYNLCNDYLSICDSISSQEILEQETKSIITLLKEITDIKLRIPEKYLKYEYIRPSCSELFIARVVRAQHEIYLTNINELYTAYQLLLHLDQCTNNIVNSICKKIFNIELLHFFRSGLGLFAMANIKYGKLNFKSLTCDEEIKNKLTINIETCRLVAYKLSFDEDKLREKWYQNELLTSAKIYQKYFPSPLSIHPLVHRNIEETYTNFLIPSPSIFLRGFSNFLYSQLLQCAYNQASSSKLDLAAKLGDVFEAHVHEALNKIFGATNVNKIPGSDERADFYIDLKECDIIIETKIGLGTYQSQSLMTPEHVAGIWSRLYKACKQCSNSIKLYKKQSKPIIAIVLIGSHITVEMLPFQKFAERSGLLDALDIQILEFLAWNSLEYSLSKTSISKFIAGLLKKWGDRGKMQIKDIISFEVKCDTAPAHNYEYLQGAKQEIFGEILNNK